jgi:hypothetical protein
MSGWCVLALFGFCCGYYCCYYYACYGQMMMMGSANEAGIEVIEWGRRVMMRTGIHWRDEEEG